ncbi:MAG: PASTA domain-containing protein [Bacteroidetes bacterium]|nr:PASTA domain-containing protein [Bacteroidota bacterium]MDA0931494.1 PASTA domain-containing protein [Bacteroidota bacterium]
MKQNAPKPWSNILKNAAAAGVVMLLLVVLTFGLFRWITRHGEEIMVPNVVGMPLDNAIESLANESLQGVFADTLFDVPDSLKEVPKGHVLEQIPLSGSSAKGGRKVRLFVRALGEARIHVPDYHSMSLRALQADFQERGFVIQQILAADRSKPKLEMNPPVLDVLFKGKKLKPGSRIEKGSKVVVIVDPLHNQTLAPNSAETDFEIPLE